MNGDKEKNGKLFHQILVLKEKPKKNTYYP